MLLQVYNDDYIVKKRSVIDGSFTEAPLHFIMLLSALTPQGQPIAQLVPLVEEDGKIVPWADGIIHVKPRATKVSA